MGRYPSFGDVTAAALPRAVLWGCQGASGSSERGEGPDAGERGLQLPGPAPGALQSQPAAASVAGDAAGDVQQPVAQRLRFGAGERAAERQPLQPCEQVLGGEHELE